MGRISAAEGADREYVLSAGAGRRGVGRVCRSGGEARPRTRDDLPHSGADPVGAGELCRLYDVRTGAELAVDDAALWPADGGMGLRAGGRDRPDRGAAPDRELEAARKALTLLYRLYRSNARAACAAAMTAAGENIEKANDNTKIILDSTGVFKDSKLIGYIDNEESIYLNYIKGEVLGTLIICECDKGNYLTSEVKNIKSTANFDKKEKKIVIEVSGDGNINEMNCYIDVEKDSGIEKIEKLVNDEVEKNINKFIRDSISKYNSDFFSFLDIIYKSDYTYYKTIKDNWYESGLKNLKFEVKSKIKITKKGNVLRDIYDK